MAASLTASRARQAPSSACSTRRSGGCRSCRRAARRSGRCVDDDRDRLAGHAVPAREVVVRSHRIGQRPVVRRRSASHRVVSSIEMPSSCTRGRSRPPSSYAAVPPACTGGTSGEEVDHDGLARVGVQAESVPGASCRRRPARRGGRADGRRRAALERVRAAPEDDDDRSPRPSPRQAMCEQLRTIDMVRRAAALVERGGPSNRRANAATSRAVFSRSSRSSISFGECM